MFKAGLPEGEVKVVLTTGAELVGWASRGVLHGKAVMRGREGALLYAGRYRDGHPEGRGWVFSPTDKDGVEGGLYLQFEGGRVVEERAVLVLPGWERAVVGRYHEGRITQGSRFVITKYRDEGCVRRIQVPRHSEPGSEEVASPVRVEVAGGRVSLASSCLLLFNRVAKVGSQGLTRLMVELGRERGYRVEVDQRPEEQYNLAPWHQLDLAERLTSLAKPTVWVRHINYIDFGGLGLAAPQWLGLVRDPVERVISNFYYRRAGWNIVERALAFPDEPWPDPAFLRRDFESCVVEGDPECSYVQGGVDSAAETGDHRRQMMQFCGQHPLCVRFNSREALEEAKVVVERSYPVVAVLELWEESLQVLEHVLPHFFTGATQMYAKKKKEVSWSSDQTVILLFQIRGMSQNFHKGAVSEEIKALVRKNFSMEIEFYEFTKKRLLNQLEEIKKIK